MVFTIFAVAFTLSAAPAAAEGTIEVVLKINTETGKVVKVGVFDEKSEPNHPNRGDRKPVEPSKPEPNKPIKDINDIKVEFKSQNPYWIKIGNKWYKIG